MFHCHVCGSRHAKTAMVHEIFEVDEQLFMVENIPATVCERCGEEMFSRETTERMRRLLHGETPPVRSVVMDVFAYA